MNWERTAAGRRADIRLIGFPFQHYAAGAA
jgi:hypothetical protein